MLVWDPNIPNGIRIWQYSWLKNTTVKHVSIGKKGSLYSDNLIGTAEREFEKASPLQRLVFLASELNIIQ